MSNFVNVREAADFLGVSTSYLNKLRCLSSDGPQFVKLGKAIRYELDDLRAWAESSKRRSTSSTGDRGAA